MMSASIDLAAPWLGAEETDAVAEVIAAGQLGQGSRVERFEREYAAAVQAKHAVATTSCTTALHLALMVAGVGPGDDVVVPSFSFVATAGAVRNVGANPVFADVDPLTGNVTGDTVADALTPVTRAVIAVDHGGVPVDLDDIRVVTDQLNIVVIENAACGAGSTYRGRPVGWSAEIATWSFHPPELLTTGEGGMLTTAREEWAARARLLREHGLTPDGCQEVGFNFRLTDLQAAVGLVQLHRLPAAVAQRRELAQRYGRALEAIPGLRAVADPEYGTSNFQSFWVEVGQDYPLDRESLLDALAAAGVPAHRGTAAAHRQRPYRDITPAVALPITERLTDATLVLPLHHGLGEADQDRVIGALRSAGGRA